MKISTDHLDQLSILRQRAQDTANKQDQGFAKLMEGKQAQDGAETKPAAEAAALLSSSPVVNMILANQKIGKNAEATRQLEKAFDQMDHYAAALGDGGKSLKDIAPLADGLKDTADRLDELSRRLPDDDPLKSLVGEAAILATVESMKFRRGDYV